MSFAAKRRNLTYITVAIVLICAALALFSIVRSSQEKAPEHSENDGFAAMLKNPDKLTEAEKNDLREKWGRLSPSTRTSIISSVLQERLEEFRKKISAMSRDERLDKIRKEVEGMRNHRMKAGAEEIGKAKELLAGLDTQKLVRDSLNMYQNETSSQERAEMDPLVHEYIQQINSLTK